MITDTRSTQVRRSAKGAAQRQNRACLYCPESDQQAVRYRARFKRSRRCRSPRKPTAKQPAGVGAVAHMTGENPATSDDAKCTGQSHQLPGQQLDQVGALHRSRLLAYRQQCRRACDQALRDRAQELAVPRHAQRRDGQRSTLQFGRDG